MSGFVIYALPVRKGILGICQMPGRDESYQDDLAHIRDWKPALVVSMTERQEFVDFGNPDLGRDIQLSGARWFSFPVPDFGVATPVQEVEWTAISDTALSALQGGGRVLIHCLGGCGRSGMAALRLMVAAGESPKDALARLRAVRPCAVETGEQKRWAAKGGAY